MYGIIGKSLIHSFSPKYFNAKFSALGKDQTYTAFPLNTITEFPALLQSNPQLKGLNVTLPFKEAVIPFLHELDETAGKIGAVNCISVHNGNLKGYNTDVTGFKDTLIPFLNDRTHTKALILGTGGAAKAVAYALKELNITYRSVTRNKVEPGQLSYSELTENLLLEHTLIINTTPLGTWPETHLLPDIPYRFLSGKHLLYDLIYNPGRTLFLKKGQEQGADIINGYNMLVAQAEASWAIWNSTCHLN